MKTFKEYIDNITKMQDSWDNFYDEHGNLCDKNGNIIEPSQPTEDYTDLSYLYDTVKSPTSDIEPKVEEVVEDKPKIASLPY